MKCVLHEVQRTVPKASILASTLHIEDVRSLVIANNLGMCLEEELYHSQQETTCNMIC